MDAGKKLDLRYRAWSTKSFDAKETYDAAHPTETDGDRDTTGRRPELSGFAQRARRGDGASGASGGRRILCRTAVLRAPDPRPGNREAGHTDGRFDPAQRGAGSR